MIVVSEPNLVVCRELRDAFYVDETTRIFPAGSGSIVQVTAVFFYTLSPGYPPSNSDSPARLEGQVYRLKLLGGQPQ